MHSPVCFYDGHGDNAGRCVEGVPASRARARIAWIMYGMLDCTGEVSMSPILDPFMATGV